jgi:glycosyltransferase involved in cell wall biosynthesis
MKKIRLLYFVSEDWYFCSHRLALAVAAKNAGFDVVVVTRVRAHGECIRQAGLRLIPFEMSRQSMNPLSELTVLWNLLDIYKRERPDIVHHVAMKPVLYGTIASKLCKIKRVVNALAGMGWLFSSGTWRARAVRQFVITLFRFLLPMTDVIVQNEDDAQLVRDLGCSKIHVIRGVGVDVDFIKPRPEPSGPCVVLLLARMLKDKGVGEYVEAAEILKGRGRIVRMLLVGSPDEQNPASIPVSLLEKWNASGVVEWLGQREDIVALLAQSHIVCLPSYREGFSKSLLEGLSAGRPLVATDVPGCREAVHDGVNGFLVPAKDATALADALDTLILNDYLRQRMGQFSRSLAVSEFSSHRIHAEMLNVYFQLTDTAGNLQEKTSFS